MKNLANFVERILEEAPAKGSFEPEFLLVTSSRLLSTKSCLSQSAFVISNAACQAVTNTASVSFAVERYGLRCIVVANTNSLPVEDLIFTPTQASDVEFRSLKKLYEENKDVLFSIYKDERQFNAAMVELNIDAQIEHIISIPFFKELVQKKELYVLGFVYDEIPLLGSERGFYLINFNGITDPAELKQMELFTSLPKTLLERRFKRFHVQI